MLLDNKKMSGERDKVINFMKLTFSIVNVKFVLSKMLLELCVIMVSLMCAVKIN